MAVSETAVPQLQSYIKYSKLKKLITNLAPVSLFMDDCQRKERNRQSHNNFSNTLLMSDTK